MPDTDSAVPLSELLLGLPSVIALPLAEYLDPSETHPVLKLWSACDTVELLLRLLVTAGLADVGRFGELPRPLINELRSRIEEPTLGKWRGMAEAIAKHIRAQPETLLSELPLLVKTLAALLDGPVRTKDEAAAPENSFAALRNFLAHGGGITRASGKRLLARWEKPFAEAILTARWFTEVDLVVRVKSETFGILRGPGTRPAPYVPADSSFLAEHLKNAGDVALVRGGHALPVTPLQYYGLPMRADSGVCAPLDPVPLIYQRQGAVRLHFTPVGSDEASQSESDSTAYAAFRALFRLDEAEQSAQERGFVVRGFEADLRRDSSKLVGRTNDIEITLATLASTLEGVLWLPGVAGIGKSFLMARVATNLLEEPTPGTLVLPYRFRLSDERCRRDTFLQFAIERLEAWLPKEQVADRDVGTVARANEEENGDRHSRRGRRSGNEESPLKPIEKLHELLKRVAGGPPESRRESKTENLQSPESSRRVLFLLDGLDEITQRDERFAVEVPMALLAPGVVWLCAGREERGLEKAFASCVRPLPQGLGEMSTTDIRSMLLENIGRYRRHLVEQDCEVNNDVSNPFIERVAECAHGLPLYVELVIRDVCGNRLRVQDAGRQLPPSLAAYYEELLRRLAIGSLHQVLTPLAVTLALARERLTPAALAALLSRRTIVLPGARGQQRVEEALAALASMIRGGPAVDDGVGYELHHPTLREHICTSETTRDAIELTREAFCTIAFDVRDDAAALYCFRNGVAHLLSAKRHADALSLLCNFPYLMARLQRLGDPAGIDGIGADWRDYFAKGGVLTERYARIAEAFWREKAHILRRGNTEWPSYKIFLQLAVERADDSPLTLAAERWLSDGRCDWLRLQRSLRLPRDCENSCLAVFEGHFDEVDGALELCDGRIVSWSADKTLRIWNYQSGQPEAVLEGHSDSVLGALELRDGRILSWSADRNLGLWNRNNNIRQAMLEGHLGPVIGALIVPGNRILSWSWDKTLRLWDEVNGNCLKVLVGHTSWIYGAKVLSDGRILSWAADRTLRLWNGTSGELLKVLKGHSSAVSGALILSGGRILSWSEDKTLRLWNGDTGQRLRILKGHTKRVLGAILLTDGRILSWSEDKTLRVWDGDDCQPIAVSRRQSNPVNGALALPDGKFVAWSDDKIIRLWDRVDGEPCAVLAGHTSRVRGISGIPYGMILSWSWDKRLRLWDGGSGKLLAVFAGHSESIRGALPLSNGRILSWSRDGTLRVWDARGGHLPAVLEGHSETVDGALAFSADSILSWSGDGTVRLWDSQSGRCQEVATENQAADQHPEWILARSESENSATRIRNFLAESQGRTGHLRHCSCLYPLAAWNGESGVSTPCLLPDGTVVVTQQNGQVCILKLYHGNRRITLGDCEEMLEQPDPRTRIPADAVARPNRSLGLMGHDWILSGLGLELIWIKPGIFTMGSPSSEARRSSDEGPTTRVTITRGFWLGRLPVTQAEWQAVMGSNPSMFKGDYYPVEQVSSEEAMAFCIELTKRLRRAGALPAGCECYLPSEAQWEYGCRAGTQEPYGGNGRLDDSGWYFENSGGEVHAVGQKRANAWGLCDMHGNVWEWCRDWYDKYPGGSEEDWFASESRTYRVVRGGAWTSSAANCRSAYRRKRVPNYRCYNLGFRLAVGSVP